VTTPEPSSDADPLVQLAEEFADRYRRGDHPTLTEYTNRYPELADRIRKLFPAMVVMEEFGSVAGSDSEPPNGLSAPPRQLGEYRILREVGRGGMGVVYEAVQESLGRHVALKVLPARNWKNPTHVERFRREARAVARLHHTNIVPVFGVGECDGVHYYAMQFIHGQSLDSVLSELKKLRQPGADHPAELAADTRAENAKPVLALSASIARGLLAGEFSEAEATGTYSGSPDAAAGGHPRTVARGEGTDRGPSGAGGARSELTSRSDADYARGVARLGVQAAEALAHAHQQGILHRDVKPANLLLDTQGMVWVTDFGLAKADDSDGLTRDGDIVGTVRYMAPERFRGAADPRSDVYGLGLTLYEMLTLRPAFDDADRPRLMEAIASKHPPAPRAIDPRIPRDLETIVLKAIAKEPSQRYSTASALAEDLRRFLADRPILARRTTWMEQCWRWCRRNPAVSILLTTVSVLLVGMVVVLAVSNAQIRTSLDHEKRAREEEQRAKENLVQSLYYQWTASAASARANEQAGRAEEMLDQCPAELRGWEWHYLKRLPFADFPTLPIPGVITTIAVSRDGRLLAAGTTEGLKGTIKIWNLATGGEWCPPYVESDGFVRGLAFSPDGRFLAFGNSRTAKVWDLVTGKPRELPGHTGLVRALAFSPDGRLLASACQDDRVRVWEVATWRPLVTITAERVAITGMSFSPDGRRLLTANLEGTVKAFEPTSGQLHSSFQGRIQQVSGVAFNPDGRLVALGSEDGTVKVWESESGKELHSLEAHSGPVVNLVFLDGDRRLASCGDDRTLKIWDLNTGREALQLGIFAKRPQAMAVSADGQRLYFRRASATAAAETVGFADGTPMTNHSADPTTVVLEGHLHNVVGVAWRPDGQRIASASWDRTAKVWEALTGRELLTLRGHEAGLTNVAFSPDGRYIASSSWDETVRLWDAETGMERYVFAPHVGPVYGVAFHPKDGRVLAAAHHDGTIKLWDTTTGQKRREFVAGRKEPLLSVAFSSDGTLLVAGWGKNEGNIAIWDAANGTQRQALQRQKPGICFSMAFHPNNRFAAGVATPNDVYLWDLATSEVRRTFSHKFRPSRMAFSPDGQHLATVCLDPTVRLWPILSEQPPVEIRGHFGDVWCVAFSPDGRRLATGAGYKGRGEIRIREAAIWEKRR
jgi:WD40 repeat protein/serine/threonine protein kinase